MKFIYFISLCVFVIFSDNLFFYLCYKLLECVEKSILWLFLFHFWVIYYFLASKFLSELNLILVFTCFQTQQPCILLSWCTVKSKQKKSILGLNRNHQLILYVLVNINIIICIYIYILDFCDKICRAHTVLARSKM